jgi:DNA repair protein RadC
MRREPLVPRVPIYRVALIRDRNATVPSAVVARPADAAAVFRVLFSGADREMFAVLCLDVRHRVVVANVVSIGSLTEAPVHPREVFKAAILCNAAALILGHVHPSGDLTPGREDIRLTKRLADAGELLGIKVLDHLIVCEHGFVSLRERGDIR